MVGTSALDEKRIIADFEFWSDSGSAVAGADFGDYAGTGGVATRGILWVSSQSFLENFAGNFRSRASARLPAKARVLKETSNRGLGCA